MKRTIIIILLSLFSFLATENASAHATPITYEPEASVILQKIPKRVQINFSERIEQGASGITVYGPDGSRIDNNDSNVDSNNTRLYGTSIQDGGEGTYTVSWQVVSSDDGHFTKGAFTFSIGKETAGTAGSGQIQVQHITTVPQAGTIGIELVGQAIILGVLVLFAFLWRPLRRKFGNDITAYEVAIRRRLSFLMIVGVVCMIIGIALFIILKTFDLQQLRIGDFFTTLQILLGTVDGSWALARAIIALIVLSLFFAFRNSIFSSERMTKKEIFLFILLFAILFSRARVSHAAASHFYPFFSILVNAVQLLFKELWVGGLIVLSTAIAPLLLRAKNKLHFAFLSTNFSKISSIAFGCVGITGAYIVWLHLKDPSYLFSTQWGVRLIILSIFGGILFIIRLYHQFLIDTSAIAICNGSTNRKTQRLISWASFTLPLEALVGIAVLFVTCFMIITTPPYASERFTFTRSAISQKVRITMSVHPYESKKFLITIQDPQKQTEIPLSDIVVTLTNEEKNIGPIVAETEQRFVGGYVLPQSIFSPSGNWKVDISARRAGAYDAVASFAINYPNDIDSTRIDPDHRSFGLFEGVIILSAFLILVLTLFLYRVSKKFNTTCLKVVENSQSKQIESISMSQPIRSWGGSTIGLMIIIFGVWFTYGTFAKTDFQKLCEKNGHFWFQSVPVRDGQALSSDTFTGCFLDVGFYHFPDKKEYEFFLQPREIVAELSHAPENPEVGVPVDFSFTLSEVKNGRKITPVNPVRELARGIKPRARIEPPDPVASRGAFSNGVKEVGTYHDRIIHAQIVGEDFKTFAHIHSEDLGPITKKMREEANFPLRYTFPKAGRYVINIDYVANGRERSKTFYVSVSGKEKMEQRVGLTRSGSQTKEFEGYRVTFTVPKTIKAKNKVRISYHIEKNGKPVRDLEPYLAAAMHIGIVREDLGIFSHTHGEAYQPGSVWFQQQFGTYIKYHIHFAPDNFGPAVIAQPWLTVFPTAGTYQVFGEFKHQGKIIVTYFTVQVK